MFDSILPAELLDRGLNVFGRWREGLLACLSPAARQHFSPKRSPIHMDLDGMAATLHHELGGKNQEIGTITLADPRPDRMVWETIAGSKEPLVLHLHAAWVLKKRISLPAAAAENLRQVIEFEMDRLTPFSADQVYFDFHVSGSTEADMLVVDIALSPRKHLLPWLELLQKHNVQCHIVSSEGLWPRANLLPPGDRPGIDLGRAFISSLPYFLLISLLAVAMLLPMWQQRNVVVTLAAKESALKPQAAKVAKIRDALEQAESHTEAMLKIKTASPPVLDVLRVLTEILPDDTWVQQLDFKADKVEVRGLSEQSSQLLKLLEESRGFRDVKFLSSVVQQRGKERFHLSAGIVHPFPLDIVGIRLPESELEPESEPEATTESIKNPAPAIVEVPGNRDGHAKAEAKANAVVLPADGGEQ